MFKTRKVVIVGAGHVGSHVALALIQSGEADDIVLIDILKEKAIGQALDLDDCVSGSLCGKDVSIRAGSYEELHDADIMVMAFGRRSIHGFCMGEHGNSSFIVWSRIFIGGKPFLQLCRERPVLAEISLEDLQTQVKKAGDIEIDGKGCTEFGIANVAKMLISAIFHDQKLVWPCSTLLRGEYGQHDVAAGVPCVIGKNGVEEILEVELTDEEQAKFAASCDILRGFLDRAASLKF